MTIGKLFLILLAVLIAAGAQAQPCTDSQGTIQVSPPSLNFGSVDVGSSAVIPVTILNLDQFNPMNILNLNSLNSRFQVISALNVPFCINENSQVVIQVRFTPQSVGKLVSRIRINNTSSNAPNFDLDVTGTGVSPGSSNFKVSPSSLSFGQVSVGQNSTQNFTITNQGNASGTVDKINSSNSAFQVISPSFPKSVAAGGSFSVNVRFAPTKSGNVSASLSVISGGSTVASVSASGEGTTGSPDIRLNPSDLDFGSTDIGTFNIKTLTVSNNGNADLDVSFPSDPFIKVTPAGPVTIKPGSSSQFTVRLIADSLGAINKSYRVNSNDPDTPRAPLGLKAAGVQGPFGFLNRTARSRIGPNPNRTSALQYVDFDSDGKTDLYLTGHDGNLMCKNSGNATFSNSTNTNKLGNNGKDSRGVAWADVDNDGDLDVFIANFDAPSAILRNSNNVFSAPPGTSPGLFAADAEQTNATGAIFLDFNNDSRIDIFVVKDGEANQLFKNLGTFQFANVASAAKVAFNGPGRGVVAADFNNDGYQDLYVANFRKPNKLYLNNKNETFRDATASAGVGFNGASEQVAAVDFDGDQDLDIFVVNNQGPSVLYRNLGTGKFQNVAGASGLAGPKKGIASTWSDFDRDGDLDLILAQSTGDNQLFRNNGNGKFSRVTNVDLGNADDPSSVVTGDSDNDGDPDVAIGDEDGGAQSGDSIYQNSGGGANNFLIVTLQGSASNRSAIGAKVVLRSGALFQAQLVSGGDGQNQSSLPLEFGLGNATTATLIIAWPSGRVQTLDNVAANQKLKITEPVN